MLSPASPLLPRSRDWLEVAIGGASDPMILVNRDHRIVVANPGITSLFQLMQAEAVGEPLHLLFPERHRAFVANSVANLDICPMAAASELSGLRNDGTEFPIEIGLSAFDTADESFVVVSVIDISERKHTEQAMQHMTALVESADDAILSKSLDGVVRSWNPGATRMLGYHAADIIGQSVMKLIPLDRQNEESMILDRIRQGQHVAHFETVRRRSDGSMIDVSLTISPIRDRSGAIVGASKIMRDISERRKSSEQLQSLNAELQRQIVSRTAQLKEREAMLQEIHHRVKNNLQVISSLINMQMRTLRDADIRSALQQCQARVATMAQIHEMLYQSNDYARVPFWRYVKDLASRVVSAAEIAPSTIALHFALAEVFLSLDRAIPCGLMLNEILANSVKHAFPNGAPGSIYIELQELAGRRILLSVRDDGVGIGQRHEASVHASLGLHLVRTLARQIDAELQIIPAPGTTFRITFPAE